MLGILSFCFGVWGFNVLGLEFLALGFGPRVSTRPYNTISYPEPQTPEMRLLEAPLESLYNVSTYLANGRTLNFLALMVFFWARLFEK